MAKPRPRPIAAAVSSKPSVGPTYVVTSPGRAARPRNANAVMTTILVAGVCLVATILGMSDAGAAVLRGRSGAGAVPTRLDALPGGGAKNGAVDVAGGVDDLAPPSGGNLPQDPELIVAAAPYVRKVGANAGDTIKGGSWAPPPFQAEEAIPSRPKGGKAEFAFRERRKVGLPPPKAFVFTMDSLGGTVEAAARGGPAGEILVRTSLERALKAIGFAVTVATTDAEAASLAVGDFDILILDEWTILAPGGRAHPWAAAKRKDVYLLSYFGLEISLLGGIKVDETQVLAAHPAALGGSTTFLGYFIEPRWAPRPRQCEMTRARIGSSVGLNAACSDYALSKAKSLRLPPLPEKKDIKGFVWGKKKEYFADRENYLNAAAKYLPLYASFEAPPAVPAANVLGHLSASAFADKLAESKIFIGLGDPLLGPSAMEAIAAGSSYIDPYYGHAAGIRSDLSRWGSQHPYLSVKVGEPYACGARLDEPIEVAACVRKAIENDLPPLVPLDFTYEGYLTRVHTIFNAFIPEGGESSDVLAALAAYKAALAEPPPLSATAPDTEPEQAAVVIAIAPPAPEPAAPENESPDRGNHEVRVIDGVKVGSGSSTGWKGNGGRKPGTSG